MKDKASLKLQEKKHKQHIIIQRCQ